MPPAPTATPVMYDQNIFAIAEQNAALLEAQQRSQQQKHYHQVMFICKCSSLSRGCLLNSVITMVKKKPKKVYAI